MGVNYTAASTWSAAISMAVIMIVLCYPSMSLHSSLRAAQQTDWGLDIGTIMQPIDAGEPCAIL